MARTKGLLDISANFEPETATPFDARAKVLTKADLLLTATWGTFSYKGMPVSVTDDSTAENNGLYILKEDDFTAEASWEQVGSGGGGGGIEKVDALPSPAVKGDVLFLNTNSHLYVGVET